MPLTVSLERSAVGLSLFTMTAIPSIAITAAVKPPSVSESFNSREAIPISQVPSIAAVIPVVESLSWISISAPLLTATYASFNFSITGVTEEDPATTTFPLTPFSLPVAIGMIVVLSALDTVGCVVLIIGSFIFVKMGHKGLGIALALANCVVPDMLPAIDEVFGIVVTGGTLLHDYKKGESLPNSIVHAIDAKDVYRNCSEEYEDMDVLQIAQNVASDYATQPAYTDPMPVQTGDTDGPGVDAVRSLQT